jgi:hypothetical protein
MAAQRWRLVQELPEGAACLHCGETSAPLVDCAHEIDGERIFCCADCAAGLARVARVGSKAALELRHEFEAEAAAQEAMLTARDTELAERARQIESLSGELEAMRAERAKREFALNRIVAAAQELL